MNNLSKLYNDFKDWEFISSSNNVSTHYYKYKNLRVNGSTIIFDIVESIKIKRSINSVYNVYSLEISYSGDNNNIGYLFETHEKITQERFNELKEFGLQQNNVFKTILNQKQ
jgi:hypothetical protein